MTADAKQVEETLEGKPYVKEATTDNKVEEEVVDIKEGEERLEEETEVKEVKEKRIDEAEETLDEAVTMKEDKSEEKKTKQGWEVFLEQDEPATDDKVEEGVVDIKQGWEVFLEQNVLATDDKVEEEVVDIKQGEEHLEKETNVKEGKEKRFDKAVNEKVVSSSEVQEKEHLEMETEVKNVTKEAKLGEKKTKEDWKVFLEQNGLATDNKAEEEVELARQEVKWAIDAQQFDEEPLVDTTLQPEVVDGVSLGHEEETNTQHGEEDKFNKQEKVLLRRRRSHPSLFTPATKNKG